MSQSTHQDMTQNMTLEKAKRILDRLELESGAGAGSDAGSLESLRAMSIPELEEVAQAVRVELVSVVSQTGGHLGAGLGVVELTVALHAVFETPEDRLIFDVGHQAYPHKLLTGRRSKLGTLRKKDGLSGFTCRAESPFDPFGAAHSSTSLSAGLGFAVARDLRGTQRRIVCVIGDGAMSAGMAYEAMNNAGAQKSSMLVILNDNDMSISPPVGAMSAYLSRLLVSRPIRQMRKILKGTISFAPRAIEDAARKISEKTFGTLTGGTLFEQMGFRYVGPIDGHRIDLLVPLLRRLRDAKGPVLLHAITRKGKGYAPAEKAADKFHGVGKFDIVSGEQRKARSVAPSYTSVFAKALIAEARKDPSVVAISAAMLQGTGLDSFAKEFPNRCFDVGIAEQHAVTFAAGMACEGLKPVVAIYSTFLQRAYDQVVHDVALQSLAVRFMLDRAGVVGADGATHAGSFDLCYLCCLPNFVVMAAGDEGELMLMLSTALSIDDAPSAVRYPRGEGVGVALPMRVRPLEIGRGRIVDEAGGGSGGIAIVSLGACLSRARAAVEILRGRGLRVTLADARFAKPVDRILLCELARDHDVVASLEDGAIGGFSNQVMMALSDGGMLERVKYLPMGYGDCFVGQGTQEEQIREIGLDGEGIAERVMRVMEGERVVENAKLCSNKAANH